MGIPAAEDSPETAKDPETVTAKESEAHDCDRKTILRILKRKYWEISVLFLYGFVLHFSCFFLGFPLDADRNSERKLRI